MEAVTYFADRLDVLQVFFVGSVREVDPGNIHSGADHVT
jgi:hypothetical protein